MRFILLPFVLLATTAHATSPETCLNMARDYLLTLQQDESVKDSIYTRERFMTNCNTDNGFGQELTKLIIENRAINAIHVRPERRQKTALVAI